MADIKFNPAKPVPRLQPGYRFNNTDLTEWINNLLDVEGGSPAINDLLDQVVPTLSIDNAIGASPDGSKFLSHFVVNYPASGLSGQFQDLVFLGPTAFNTAGVSPVGTDLFKDSPFTELRIDGLRWATRGGFTPSSCYLALSVAFPDMTAPLPLDNVAIAGNDSDMAWYANPDGIQTIHSHPTYADLEGGTRKAPADQGHAQILGKRFKFSELLYLAFTYLNSTAGSNAFTYDLWLYYTLF